MPRRHSVTIIIDRTFMTKGRRYTGRSFLGIRLKETFRETRIVGTDRKGDVHNFVAYDPIAASANSFLLPGITATVDYIPFSEDERTFDDEDLEGEVISFNDITDHDIYA